MFDWNSEAGMFASRITRTLMSKLRDVYYTVVSFNCHFTRVSFRRVQPLFELLVLLLQRIKLNLASFVYAYVKCS